MNKSRVIIENIKPAVNCGEYPIKRVVNEKVSVSADIFGDGHDIVQASIHFKPKNSRSFQESRLHPTFNDQWEGNFKVEKQGYYDYHIEAWVDHGLTWRHGIIKKIEAGQKVNSELLEGADLLKPLLKTCTTSEAGFIKKAIEAFTDENRYEEAASICLHEELHQLLVKYPHKAVPNESKNYQVYVDREKARFSTWYEFFPRSASSEEGKHGTFKDCEELLPRISEMGFDTLYFPPIHPIGEENRKGKNNATRAKEDDVGSPWGIGSEKGGHKSIHPELGDIDDFRHLVKKAQEMGIEVAMDYALQTAPDHPYVKEHPKWFKWRPDGTIQYAENPPKKYQDILPIYFESSEWKKMWQEFLDVMLYWIEEAGIRIFRVDNPHTKPFYFWGWLINEIKKKHPDILFLSEAFTRPKIMSQLAKQGFTQSYTYFTWRTNKHELTEYVNELTKSELKEYFRPNFWPNTPDINPYHLQGANESMFMIRYFLAATLSSNTGIYGPVYEFQVSDAIPGREEYLNSEKYQVSHWDWKAENKLMRIIAKINKARKTNTSLQQTNNIQFCDIHDDGLMAYYKWDEERENETLMVVSLDPYYQKQGTVRVPRHEMGLHHGENIRVEDQITGNSYNWDKEWCYIELHPAMPFHLFTIHKNS
ncbi:alpha-1,4-glucan--maltose-1-phosphate maltosyltransferase [Christiangramia fulva]|uniref:Alpha-1,4-glucan:maltose-1-phosphate maltosyltransferase n=1 Tax=Christiangramia fulva TaxID=2126553 RepID=A0A2R3Z245_9FLAO|nr:alpha-1,4-glucan--maltose-1-phosphate maltosyltransferase [Christiangramia fulva]AVR44343.1 alpha-1,4-glucan--maltose-1-phosphate maltosyltransferase [Christiangramia fulva]